MLYWSPYEKTNEYIEYISDKVNKKKIINHDFENKLSQLNTENDGIKKFKIYSLTNPYNNNVININNLFEYNDVANINHLKIDMLNICNIGNPLLKKVLLLIQKHKLKNLKFLEVEVSENSTECGKIIITNIPKSLQHLNIHFELCNKTISIDNLNNKLISLCIFNNVSVDYFHKHNFIINFFPNSLTYFEINGCNNFPAIKKKHHFTNKLEVILLYNVFYNKIKQKFPTSIKIIVYYNKIINNYKKLSNIIKIVTYKEPNFMSNRR